MRFLRMRPAVWAMISCSFSSLTRNVAFGSSSVTTPGNSKSSSFAIRNPGLSGIKAPPTRTPEFGAKASGIGQAKQLPAPDRENSRMGETKVLNVSTRAGGGATCDCLMGAAGWGSTNGSLAAIRADGTSLVAPGRRGEPRPDPPHEVVAHGAVGVEPLLAIAFDRSRIG